MRCGAGKIFVVGVAYVEILIELYRRSALGAVSHCVRVRNLSCPVSLSIYFVH